MLSGSMSGSTRSMPPEVAVTARKRRRLLLLAACFALGGVIGWKWGAPERENPCRVCEVVR